MKASDHRRASVLVLTLATGCGGGSFACQSDMQCVSGGVQGWCEDSGGCSFEDTTCESGRRYGDHSPRGLGGECVPLDTAGTGTDDDGGPTSSPGSSASTTPVTDGADDLEPTMGIGDSAGTTTADPPATDSGAQSSTGTPAEESSTGSGLATFFDAFDRPENVDIGNGWIEKTPGAFGILDEQVEMQSALSLNFRDNLFYRPLSEALLDVEVTVVVNFVTDDPSGYPQIHLRVQPDDVDTPTSLTSYAVFVDVGGAQPSLTVNRIAGAGFGPYESVAILPPPIDAETYRLRGRVSGTDPVVVEGFFEVLVDGAWEIRTEATLVDDFGDRITEPGTMGASGHVELQHFVLDDFGYTEL